MADGVSFVDDVVTDGTILVPIAACPFIPGLHSDDIKIADFEG